ncbi:MAG: tetratricopeptide repeat protein [bacterium]|nr:tetratricopeptide repeat protein [bacterium]
MASLNTASTNASRIQLSSLLRWALIIVTVTVFYPVVHFDFVDWDDNMFIFDNPHFQPVTWQHLWVFWSTSYAQLYIPLTYTIWGALVWLSQTLMPGQLTAQPFHALNLLLHVSSVLVVYQIGLRVFYRERRQPDRQAVSAAAVAALVFALHPLQIESLAWVSGMKDVLCGYLALVAIWQFVAYMQAPPQPQRLHYGLATGAFVLALMAKPAAVTVPVIAGLLAIVWLKHPPAQTLRPLGGWMLIAIAWAVLTKMHQPELYVHFIPPVWTRPVIAADALTFYLGKLIWPAGLTVHYGRTPQVVLAHGWGYLTLLAPLALGGGLWWFRRHVMGLTVAIGILIICLLPVLGFIPFEYQNDSTVADRYIYLAMLGPALGLGWIVRQNGQYRSVWVFSCLIVVLLGWRSMNHLPVWHNTMTLFTHTLRVNPNSDVAHNNLGTKLLQQGKTKQAIFHYRKLLQINHTSHVAHYNLAQALYAEGQVNDAIAHFTQALKLQPAWPQAHNNLASALLQQGKIDRAIQHYRQAIQFQPDWMMPHHNLGVALMRQGNIDAAITLFSQATEMAPVFAHAPYNLAKLLQQKGRLAEAANAFRETLRRRPDWPQAANELAWLLLSQSTPSSHNITEAVRLAKYASHAKDNRDPTTLYTLAVAYGAAGKWPAATETARQALKVAEATGDTIRTAQIQTWLHRHQQRFAAPSTP